MKLVIQKRQGVLTPELKEWVERRLLFALSRFTGTIDRVHVVITDNNGPKGGVDQACRMSAFLKGGETLTVSYTDEQLEVAASRAADRLGRTISRHLERGREGRKAPSHRLDLPNLATFDLIPENTDSR